MAIHIGHRRGGWPGLCVAGASFILPAALIVTAFAWAYVRFGKLPQAAGLLYGIKPVIIAVVLQALWGLGRSAIKTKLLAVMGVAGAVLNLAGVNELIILFATGILDVLLAFLRADLVDRWHWLTEIQLLDAIAVGQMTPGPVFTTATFIGYLLGGPSAALLATVGIFLPAFIFVALSGPFVPRLRASPVAGSFLDGVNVASLALMAAVIIQLLQVALVDWLTLLLAVSAAIFLLRWRVNSAWLVLGGAVIGVVKSLL